VVYSWGDTPFSRILGAEHSANIRVQAEPVASLLIFQLHLQEEPGPDGRQARKKIAADEEKGS
jgi:hypothetical protein